MLDRAHGRHAARLFSIAGKGRPRRPGQGAGNIASDLQLDHWTSELRFVHTLEACSEAPKIRGASRSSRLPE
jgi:hypothetical protein